MNIKDVEPKSLEYYQSTLGTRLNLDTKNIVNSLVHAELQLNNYLFNVIKNKLISMFPSINNDPESVLKVTYKNVTFVGNCYTSCVYETLMPDSLIEEADTYLYRKLTLETDIQILRQKVYQYIIKDSDRKLKRYFPNSLLEKMIIPTSWVNYMKNVPPDVTYQTDKEFEDLVSYYFAKLVLYNT